MMRVPYLTIKIHLAKHGYQANEAQISEIQDYLSDTEMESESVAEAIEEAIKERHWELTRLQTT